MKRRAPLHDTEAQDRHRDAAIDPERLAGLMRRLGSLRERERSLVGLAEAHRRAEADFGQRLNVPTSGRAEADRRSNLRRDVGVISDAVSDAIDDKLSALETERQHLFSRMSEEGMREGLWVRNPIDPRTGITLHGPGASRTLWEAPWRAARVAPADLLPGDVLACARFSKEQLLLSAKLLLASLAVLIVSCSGVYALAQSQTQPPLAVVVGQLVLPLAACAATLAFLVDCSLFLPVSLYGFCRPDALMRRRARSSSAKPVGGSGRRGDPSLRGGPRGGDVVRNDDPE